jgi:D-serine deaminase-like pyridoxal phosphate-dependent protein
VLRSRVAFQESAAMNSIYAIDDTAQVFSPALIFYKDIIRDNIARAVEMAGDPKRLRPHVKTHKTREIVRLGMAAGITKHKCATLAEAEMLATCNVPDVFLAYNIVGPNCERLVQLIKKYPRTKFTVQADHPDAVQALSDAAHRAGVTAEVLVDLDVGMHRTGIAPGDGAVALYEQIDQLPGLKPGGLHAYDGQNHQESLDERRASVEKLLEPVLELRRTLAQKGLPVPRIVGGGTPSFPVWAKLDLPGLECSPGTLFLHDHGYGLKFREMDFTPAALLLTRVISKPEGNRLTLDLGYKAVAGDPPVGKRCTILNVPDYQPVIHSEEHLVIETPHAARFAPGDEVFAVPTHVCPTCSMHRTAHVVEGGRVVGQWEIAARDRMLTV